MTMGPGKNLWFALAVCALVLCGCAAKPTPTRVTVDRAYLQDLDVHFSANGQPVSQVRIVDDNWELMADGTLQSGRFTPPVITADVTLPCGHKQVSFQPEQRDWEAYATAIKEGRAYGVSYSWPELPDLDALWLTVDNRGREAADLQFGAMRFPIAANAQVHVDAYIPQCESVAVRFHGEVLGTVLARDVQRGRLFPMVLVAAPNHCYGLTSVNYQPEGLSVPLNGKQETKRLAGQRLYILPSRFSFAPNDVPPTTTSGLDDIYELDDARCR